MVLRLNPKLVVGDVAKVPDVHHGKEFTPGYRAWVMPDRSEPGHVGLPAQANPEKGEALSPTSPPESRPTSNAS